MQDDDFGRAEIKRLTRHAVFRIRVPVNIVGDDFDDPFAQGRDGRKVLQVQAGPMLSQHNFITDCECPMSKVVGESLADKMVLLQSAKGVLKDGVVWTGVQRLKQLRQGGRFLPSDTQQVCRTIEVK